MKIFPPALGMMLLLTGFTNLAVAAPDTFDKLELRATFTGDKHEIQTLAFSPDGKILASTGRGSTIQLWDTVNGKSLRLLKGHGETKPEYPPLLGVRSVAFSPDGKTLASSGPDDTIRLWDVATGECTSVIKQRSCFNSLLFSPDGKSLLVEAFFLLELQTEKKQTVLDDYMSKNHSRTFAKCYDPKGQLLIASPVDLKGGLKTLMVWSSAEDKKPLTLKGHATYVMQLALSHDGALLASADGAKTIRIWDLVVCHTNNLG